MVDDFALAARWLKTKYEDVGVWDYPCAGLDRESWKTQVAIDETLDGYWLWVAKHLSAVRAGSMKNA